MRVRRRDTTALAVGSMVNGLLAYALFAATTRYLGSTDAAPVSVLWTFWSFASAAFTFPLQHWVARAITAGVDGPAVAARLRRVTGVVLVLSVALGAGAFLARERLFHSEEVWFPVLVTVTTVGSALMGVVRGVLSGRQRFGAVASTLASENALRCVVVLVLVVAGTGSPVAFGCAIPLGYLVLLRWLPALRFEPASTQHPSAMESGAGMLGNAAVGQLISQVVLTGGPVLLAAAGGSAADTTVLFAGLALFRAPYTVALGVVPQFTVKLTTVMVSGDRTGMARARRITLAAAVGLAVVAGVLGAALGPLVLRLVFGPEVDLSAGVAAVLATGSGLAIANLLETLVVMVEGDTRAVLLAWVLGLGVGLATWALMGPHRLESAATAFLVAEVGAFATMLTAGSLRRAVAAD